MPGEEALHAAMKPYGGFDHTAQTLPHPHQARGTLCRVQRLEPHLGDARGRGEAQRAASERWPHAQELPAAIVEYCQDHDLELDGYAGPEAQIAALSDDIAYNNHDIDDGLRAGLFEVADLMALPLVGDMFSIVTQKYPGIGHARLIHEAVRRVINAMVEDVLDETRQRLAEAAPKSVADIRALGRPVVAFSPHMAATDRTVKAFLYKRMYEHWKLNARTPRPAGSSPTCSGSCSPSQTACRRPGASAPSRPAPRPAPAWWPTTSPA